MARTTDRQHISEAVRKQSLWRRESFGEVFSTRGSYVRFVTDYDEGLYVRYGRGGTVVEAYYEHWDETGRVVYRERYSKNKRRKVLDHLRQKDVDR